MKLLCRSLLHLIAVIACIAPPAHGGDGKRAEWRMVKSEALDGITVQLSQPVLVARSRGFLWFPTIIRLGDGELLAMLNNYADEVVTRPTALLCRSHDGGLTWSEPKEVLYGDSNFALPSGDQLLLPYNLYPGPDDRSMKAPYQVCPKRSGGEIRLVEQGLTITGLPRADAPHPKRGTSGFMFNGGGVRLTDGGYLASLSGIYKGSKRSSLLMVHSVDGTRWNVRSTVAADTCPLDGAEGPSEAATCRLKDGRLMCIFRLSAGKPYGQSFSSDEGRTWTDAVAISDVFSVQPCLVVLDDGALVLSGGRPGLFLWINLDGTGKTWQRVDMRAHHDACVPDEPIRKLTTDEHSHTTAYTRIVPVGPGDMLYIYDRVPHGWHATPKDSSDTNSVRVVRVVLTKS